jgi:DNA end-binding protein Ku
MPPARTGILSFGLVAIPVRIRPATQNQNVSFNWLHAKCGSRVRNRHHCPVCDVAVERDDLIRGYEFAKDQYVRFTEAELETLETEASKSIDLKEFVPLSKIDPVYFESSHYLGADEGGGKPYRLLADAMAKTGRAALAELVTRGKEQLVLIRPYRDGLMMHTMYYANEVRNFGEIPKAENAKLSDEEIQLGTDLIESMSDEFKPDRYKDEYRIRVLAMLDEKSKGQQITVPRPTEPRHGQVIDLMQALKQSMEQARPNKKAATAQRKRKMGS